MTYYKELGKKLREHHKIIEQKVENLKIDAPEDLDSFCEVAKTILAILESISNVDNTSDIDKPISTAQQEALDTKVPNTRTVNGKALSEDITLKASDIGADASGAAANQITSHNISTTAHNDIRTLITGLTNRLNALADSDDDTLDQMSEIVAYIKSNKTLIESITTSKVNTSDIINNLTTNIADKPLSAAQGVVLKELITTLETTVSNLQASGGAKLYSTTGTNTDGAMTQAAVTNLIGDIGAILDDINRVEV